LFVYRFYIAIIRVFNEDVVSHRRNDYYQKPLTSILQKKPTDTIFAIQLKENCYFILLISW